MGQPRKRLIAFGIAIFSGVAALSMLHGGWRDYSLAVELRDRGALAEGRYLGAEIFTSRERTSAGRINAYETVEREHGRWSYRSEEHTSELQSLMRISYAVFCLKKKK